MSLTKRLFIIASLGLVLSLTATGFAQDGGVDPTGGTGYLRSQATLGGGLVLLGYFFGLAISGLGSAMGLGRAVSAALDNIGRQPEAAGDIRLTMIIGCALIEALTIYMLISPFLAQLGGITISV